jgi:phosphoribosylanthranilate isomerase
MMQVRIKICGITRLEDALRAAELGVDAIGFIFVSSSARFIEPGAARKIIQELPPFTTPVGVFVNEKRERIDAVLRSSGIRALQLHGEEAPGEITGFQVPVIKGFRVRQGFDVAVLDRYDVSAHLLDAHVEGAHGGTGRTFDWNIAVEANRDRRIILSGGLIPRNVAAAIRQVRPYGVDVSSGVELSPGIKDASLMQEFVHRAREAAAVAAGSYP